MAPHSSTLAWKIPWTEEPGGLQSMGSQRVGHDWTTSLSLFTFHFHALEKEMATHSSVLAWRIPGMGKPGGLPSMGSHRVRHDWSDLAAAAAAAMRNRWGNFSCTTKWEDLKGPWLLFSRVWRRRRLICVFPEGTSRESESMIKGVRLGHKLQKKLLTLEWAARQWNSLPCKTVIFRPVKGTAKAQIRKMGPRKMKWPG